MRKQPLSALVVVWIWALLSLRENNFYFSASQQAIDALENKCAKPPCQIDRAEGLSREFTDWCLIESLEH